MIPRRKLPVLRDALARQAAVALIGARQVGKTTLALKLSEEVPSLYLDLEASQDRRKLADPALFLSQYEDRLVVLDEIHRVPELFSTLRGLIDQGRRRGHRTGRFLLLGSASMDLLRQSGESLAGRRSGPARRPRIAIVKAPRFEPAVGTRWLSGQLSGGERPPQLSLAQGLCALVPGTGNSSPRSTDTGRNNG